MRVVAGKHRSRQLISPKNRDVRPTTDMVKESIFNIIQNDVVGSKFLDLFAGSGAIGIEAISRGAEKVVFVDSSKESIGIVKQNLQMLKEDAQVIFGDYQYALSRLKNAQFDIIFLDPPYDFKEFEKLMALIAENNVLANCGIVVYESLFNKNDNKCTSGYNIVKSKKYGITAINIYEAEWWKNVW